MNLRLWLIAILSLGLAACGNSALQDRALQVLINEPSPQTVNGQFVRFRPLFAAGKGPALAVRIPAVNLTGGFLLESRRGHIESWLGNDGVSLTFDRGVLHGTRGFGAGMLASDVSATADMIYAGRSGEVKRVHTFLTGNDETDTQTYVCEIIQEGSETITLDKGAVATRKVTENCFHPERSFTNTYWLATREGRIVKSEQWSGTEFGMLEIRTVYNF